MAFEIQYKEGQDARRVGMIVNTENNTMVSRIVEGAPIGFGKAVVQGSADKAVVASGDGAFGITVRQRNTIDDTFAVGESARVMLKGVIVVESGAAVSAGDPVHVAAGVFSNTGGAAIANARYETSAASGGLVEVRLA